MADFLLEASHKSRSSSDVYARNQSAEPIGGQDNLSASVNLDDIIETFDGTSKSSSRRSLANLRSLSLSRLSAKFGFSQYDDQDTTSFYSALQESYSLSEYYTAGISGQPDGTLLSLAIDESSERDIMLPGSNFEVFWQGLSYRIEPTISVRSLICDLEKKVTTHLLSALSIFKCSRSLSSYDIEANRDLKRKPVTIIQDISGSFRSGELTAVLGPSGAGKTSLLNFLSRRREEGYSGKLYAKNVDRRLKISTIPQHDSLPEYLTVRENMLFASRIKNPLVGHNHEANVERVAGMLGLDVCLDTRTKKISGGQQKRLAIAQELLSQPDILILDEPTSGLDSLTCLKTIMVLKDLVRESMSKLASPIAIVVTIHQPQEEVFELFDRIYVMANGGKAIYDGPPGTCAQFIETHTGIKLHDEDYNPATLLIEIASAEYGQEPIDVLANQVKLEFESKNLRSNDKISLRENNLDSKSGADRAIDIDRRIARGRSMQQSHFWFKTRVLTGRCWISVVRDPKQMIARLLFYMLMPIVLSLMMGPEPGTTNACPKFKAKYQLSELVASDELSSESIQEDMLLSLENIGFFYILIYSLTSASIGSVTLSFTQDIQRSLKEYFNGWYSMGSYLLARLITEIPVTVIMPLLTLTVGFSMSNQDAGTGFPAAYRILIMAIALMLGTMIAQIMGMIFGAIYIGHITTALFASQGATLPFVFLSGFVVRTKNMSWLIHQLSYTSYLRHVLEITVVARYGFNLCNCDSSKLTGKDVELVGVSPKLKAFMDFWISSSAEQDSASNGTQADDNDVFQLVAKQISLYNTYGIQIKSCADVIPYQLYETSVTEDDLPRSFISLLILNAVMLLLLYLTVKLVIKFRTSL